MDAGGGNGGDSFEVDHGSDTVKVTDVYKVGDVVREREMRIKSNSKVSAQ